MQSGTEETAEHALARAGAEPGELLETGSSGNADVPTRGVTEPTGFESTTGAEVGRADAGRETDGPGRLVAPEPETIEAPAGGTAEGGPGEPRPGIRPEPGSTEEEGYRVQAVAVPDPIVADFEAAHLRRLLGAEIPVYVDFVTPFYKVRVGDFATRSEASETLARVRELGYVDAWAVPSGIRAPSP